MKAFSSQDGILKYEEREQNGATGINVWHFKVGEDGRSSGQGARLLSQVIELSKEQEYEFVTVNMGGGVAAKRLLEKFGFTVTTCDTTSEIEEEQHVDGFQNFFPHDWNRSLEEIPEEKLDDWTGWTQ